MRCFALPFVSVQCAIIARIRGGITGPTVPGSNTSGLIQRALAQFGTFPSRWE
jgi:hypothetical protein